MKCVACKEKGIDSEMICVEYKDYILYKCPECSHKRTYPKNELYQTTTTVQTIIGKK